MVASRSDISASEGIRRQSAQQPSERRSAYNLAPKTFLFKNETLGF